MSLKNLGLRTLTGAIFVLVLVGSMLVHKYLFGILFILISILGTIEFNKIIQKGLNVSTPKWISLFANIICYILILVSAFDTKYSYLLYLILILLPILMILEMYRKTETPIFNIATNLISVAYIAIPFGILNFFYNFQIQNSSNGYFLMAYFMTIWASDTGAYLIGSTFGKHRFFERISPKKSWEGFWGGLIFSLIIGFLLNQYFEFLPQIVWFGLNIIIVLTASFGDLAESMIKRNLKIKDSGNILPGHGGILDRFDAVIFSSPFVFIYLQLFNFLR